MFHYWPKVYTEENKTCSELNLKLRSLKSQSGLLINRVYRYNGGRKDASTLIAIKRLLLLYSGYERIDCSDG